MSEEARERRISGGGSRLGSAAWAAGIAGALTAGLMFAPGAGAGPSTAAAPVMGPVNGGFEEPVVDGDIPGWTHTHGAADPDSFSVVDTRAAEGEYSLLLHNPSSEISAGLRSDAFDVEGGNSFRVAAQVYIEEYTSPGASALYFYFYDDDGQQLEQHTLSIGRLPRDSWQDVTLDADAPDEATSAAVLWYSSIANIATYHVDDVRVLDRGEGAVVEDLGIAMSTPNVRLGATDVLPDGTPVGYLFSDGNPVSFNVVDLRDGEMLDSIDMTGYTVASSIVVDTDHRVYFSVRAPNDGTLWRYDPLSQELETLATRLAGEAMLRSLLLDGDTLYGTTYPNAKVYAYDIPSGDVRDYGSVIDDGDYAWGFEQVGDELWVGTGAVGRLMSVDPESGVVDEIGLPHGVAPDFVNRIVRHGDLVFVAYSPASPDNVAVYDRTAGEWCCSETLEQEVGAWTRDSVDGLFFYLSGGSVHGYDIDARETVSIGWDDGPLATQLDGTIALELVELGTEQFPGTTLVGLRGDGTVWRYNLAEGSGDVVTGDIDGAPATIHSVGNGPDGNVYFGAYLSPGVMARVNHQTGDLEQLSGPGQADSMIAHKNRIVVGVYPNASFYVGKTNKDWDWGANPSHLFTLGRGEPHGQDRPLHMVSAGDLVAAGTIPNYGELGGALVLLNPNNGDHEVHRHVVEDQSVTALEYRDGLVYAGTSIHGGLSSEPTQEEAELFIWDVQQGEKVWSGAVPGATIIHAMTFTPDGRLWVLTEAGTIAEFDPDTREIVRSFETGIANSNIWGRLSELYYRGQDGYVYGNTSGRLFRFDPDDLDFEVLVSSGARQSGIDGEGTIYFADETNVYRYVPAGAE
ncbi:hypothetical protein [Phytoactinopolyspora mesophila]|uniref:PQQ-binding-like beta-propeller repeat protein n=1 Tax=Phytoactinopolyspora mesophila TaxID=2650750 RepID=A0A7K3M955_9ACTN|nr:hypothetical protein [Phytoactinopolyspora mesophila]NDL59866.1 hypothetical protein [Phytoactinopolyspora mesophila]